MGADTQPLQLGGGCTYYLKGEVVSLPLVATASGFATQGLPVPALPALIGQSVHAQGLVADPQGGFAGIAFTAALKLVIGN
jgi:hypothetical protein